MQRSHSDRSCNEFIIPEQKLYNWAITFTKMIEMLMDGDEIILNKEHILTKNSFFSGCELRKELDKIARSNIEFFKNLKQSHETNIAEGRKANKKEIVKIKADLEQIEQFIKEKSIRALLRAVSLFSKKASLSSSHRTLFDGFTKEYKKEINEQIKQKIELEGKYSECLTSHTHIESNDLTQENLQQQIDKLNEIEEYLEKIGKINETLSQKVKLYQDELNAFKNLNLEPKYYKLKKISQTYTKWNNLKALKDPTVTNSTFIVLEGRPSLEHTDANYRSFLAHLYNAYAKEIRNNKTSGIKLLYLLGCLHALITGYQKGEVQKSVQLTRPLTLARKFTPRTLRASSDELAENSPESLHKQHQRQKQQAASRFMHNSKLENFSEIIKNILEVQKFIVNLTLNQQINTDSAAQLSQLCYLWERDTLTLVPDVYMIHIKRWFIADMVLFLKKQRGQKNREKYSFELSEYLPLQKSAVFTVEECNAVMQFMKLLDIDGAIVPDLQKICNYIRLKNLIYDRTMSNLLEEVGRNFQLGPQTQTGFLGTIRFYFNRPKTNSGNKTSDVASNRSVASPRPFFHSDNTSLFQTPPRTPRRSLKRSNSSPTTPRDPTPRRYTSQQFNK